MEYIHRKNSGGIFFFNRHKENMGRVCGKRMESISDEENIQN